MLSLCLNPTTVQYVILTRQMIIVGASLSEIRVEVLPLSGVHSSSETSQKQRNHAFSSRWSCWISIATSN